MKRKFKHIDQYQQKGQSFPILYHSTQNTMTYDVAFLGPGLEQKIYCGGVKPINGIPAILSL
jgi:hypothetical protein